MSLGQFALLYTAMAVGMPAGLASLVLQARVVVTVLLSALLLHERPSRPQVVGVAVGAAGLCVVGLGRSAATPAVGLVLVVGAATSWAVGNVIVRRASARAALRPTAGPGGHALRAGLSMTVWSATVVPLPLFLLSLVIDGPEAVGAALLDPGVPAVLSTLYTAWLASLLGYGIWNTLLARHPASAVVPFAMLVPLVGITTAWVVQGEAPNAWEAAGGVLLLLGVALTTGVIGPRRRPVSTPPSLSTPGRAARHLDRGPPGAGVDDDPRGQPHHAAEHHNGSVTDMLALTADLPVEQIPAGSVLISEGAAPSRMLVLVSGTVTVERDGTPFARVDFPGAVFGEMSWILDKPATATARAGTDVVLRVVDDPGAFFGARPGAALAVLEMTAVRLDGLTQYLVDVKNQFAGRDDHLAMVDGILHSLVHHQAPRPRPGSARDPEVH